MASDADAAAEEELVVAMVASSSATDSSTDSVAACPDIDMTAARTLHATHVEKHNLPISPLDQNDNVNNDGGNGDEDDGRLQEGLLHEDQGNVLEHEQIHEQHEQELPAPEYQYSENTSVPVFRPNLAQFSDFARFVKMVEPFGRKCGLVKVIPPKEWTAQCTSMEKLKTKLENVRIKGTIVQNFTAGSALPQGFYRQINISHRKSYSGEYIV
jgi:hypothetical protein